MTFTLPLLLLGWSAAASGQTAAEIMAKVAANQDRASDERKRYTYTQTVRSRLVRTNGKLAREEFRTYKVLPGGKNTEKEMVEFRGAFEKAGKMHPYSEPGHEHKRIDIDGGLIDDLTDELVNDDNSRDGIAWDLYPLRSERLDRFDFELLETTQVNSRRAWRIRYSPKKNWEGLWGGEALIDAEEFEPINIYSKQAFRIPWGVRVFLGTNIQQLGFNTQYKRIAPGVWFPVSYGTEFRLDVLWRYKRVITMALTSGDFREARADSTIRYEIPEP